MKPVSILAMVGLLAASAFGQSASSPVSIPRVEFEKLTVRHLFDVAYTTKRQKIQSATVIAVSPKTEQEGVSIGDELMKINGKAIKGLTIAAFKQHLQAHEATTYSFRRGPLADKSSLRELTLVPVAKVAADTSEQK